MRRGSGSPRSRDSRRKRPARARIARLPGLTNRVYRVELARRALRAAHSGRRHRGDHRPPRRGSERRAAAAAGVAPEVIHFGDDGVMLTRFVEGEPLTPRELEEDSGALERAALALRRLHDGAGVFARGFEPFAIDRRLCRRARAASAGAVRRGARHRFGGGDHARCASRASRRVQALPLRPEPREPHRYRREASGSSTGNIRA